MKTTLRANVQVALQIFLPYGLLTFFAFRPQTLRADGAVPHGNNGCLALLKPCHQSPPIRNKRWMIAQRERGSQKTEGSVVGQFEDFGVRTSRLDARFRGA